MGDVTPIQREAPGWREMLAGIKIIDVDTHISESPDLWTSRAPAALRDRVPRMVEKDGKRRWVIEEDTPLSAGGANSAIMKDGSKVRGFEFVNNTLSDVHEASHNVHSRVKYMDDQGIYAQIAYPNVLGFGGQKAQIVEEGLRVASTQIFNDAMAEMQVDSGNRIFPMALLPWWDVKKAAAEAERCSKMGLRGVNINSDPHLHDLPPLGDAYWNPLWDVCEANGLPVNFHIGASDSSTSWFYNASWPNSSMNQMLALSGVMLFVDNLRVMGNILMSRFLEKRPNLKFVSVESGAGWVPYLLEALEYMSKESGVTYDIPPTEIFRRQIFACTFFEQKNFLDTLRQVGADNIMFESDFPHPACLYPDAFNYLEDAIAGMTAEERRKVFSENAAKLYNIPI
jgi:predicted TIM-barrel fold metal-dependent hydrolase